MRHLLVALLLPSVALASPVLIPYSARLFDTDGLPASGPVTLTIELFDSPTGPTATWSETWSNVALIQGNASLVLGSATALNSTLFTGGALWIRQCIPGQPCSERQPILPVPTARVTERVPALTAPATSCSTSQLGRMYFDTTLGQLQLCASPPAWTSL